VEFDRYSVVGLRRLFGVSKQAYYKTANHVFERSVLKHFIIEYVQGVREQSPGTGGEKLWLMYQSFFGHSYSVGRDSFLEVLRTNGLMLRRHCRSTRTTDSRHGLRVYPDLVQGPDLLKKR
jgi:hypothetical protein